MARSGLAARASPPSSTLVVAVVIGLAGGLVSILLSRIGGHQISMLWLPNALLLSLVAVRPGWKGGPIILFGCAATALANLIAGDPPGSAALMAVANAASVSANLFVLRRLFPEGPSFARPTYILRIALAAVAGGIASALIGAPTLAAFHGGDTVQLFSQWLLADALSTLLLLPLVVQIADYRAAPMADRPNAVTIAWVTLMVMAGAALVFGQTLLPSLFLLAPILLTATLSLGALGAAVGVVATAAVAVPLTLAGYGPVARIYAGSLPAQFLFLQLYCVVLIFSTAPVAGTLAYIRRISRDLAESEQRYSSLVGNLGDVIFRTDRQGRLTFLNLAWERLTGRAVDACLGRPYSNFLTPEDRRRARALLLPVARGSADRGRMEVASARPDGTIVWCDVTIEVERDANGDVAGTSGTIRDITEARGQHQALVLSEDRFRTIAEYATDMIVSMDENTRCVYVSPSVTEILGHTPEAVIGHSFYDFVHPDDLADRKAKRDSILRDPARDAVSRFRARRHDGSWRWLEARTRVVDVGPDRPRFLSVMRDVDKNIRLEEALVAARDAAEATARAKSDFVAMISHEIRTPMTGILGMVDLLAETGSAAERARFVRVLGTSSRSLMRILDDVLDVAKLEAGAVRIELARFDLHALIVGAADLFGSAAAARGLSIDLVCDAPAQMFVMGDAGRIQQVLANLIGNAIKFTSEGRIVIGAVRADGDRWRLTVADPGIGIAPDALDGIFDAFAQADVSTTRRFGGTGLGLTISRRLVAAMGGTLGVESAVGAGSTFAVELPLPPAPAEITQHAPAAEVRRGDPLSVLVAEDNPVNSLLIGTLLKRMGHRVLSVDNGRAAVLAARQGGYDAILMDVRMPVMDGIDAAVAIRALPDPIGRVPIIAVTADRDAESAGRFATAGFAAVIAKPIDRAALADALAMLAPRDPTLPDLDRVALAEMRAQIGDEGADRLLALFVTDGRRRAGRLATAIEADDLALIRAEAHAIAGGASAACARRLESVARRAMRRDSARADGEALASALAAAVSGVEAARSAHMV